MGALVAVCAIAAAALAWARGAGAAAAGGDDPTVTPTPTTAVVPLGGRWGGQTTRGFPVVFYISADGAQWTSFALTTNFSAPQCNIVSRTIEIPALGPGPVISGHMAYSGNFAFDGWFTATALASGLYTLTNYPVSVGMDAPPYVCEYALNETGAWSAGAVAGTPTRTPTATRTPTGTPTHTRTPTATRTPTRTFTPSATFTQTRTRTLTRTNTSTPASSPTITQTPTISRTPTNTRTRTPTWTGTPSGYRLNLPVILRYYTASR